MKDEEFEELNKKIKKILVKQGHFCLWNTDFCKSYRKKHHWDCSECPSKEGCDKFILSGLTILKEE